MDSSPYTITIFVILIGLCYGEGVLPNIHYGAVEGKVIFTTTLAPTNQPHLVITWAVNGTSILTHRMNQPTEVVPAYQNRVSLDVSTGSLELRNLTMKDSGVYTVSITPAAGIAQSGTTRLQVLEPVSNVVITASPSDVVEFNSSVSLSCSSSGSSPFYHWLNGSSEVTASDNVYLGDGNASLIIVNVTRYDQGPWRCNVTNLVSHNISQPFNIPISYGPEDTVVEVSPLGGQYVAGSAVKLSCSAHSKPVAQYHWLLNGAPLSNERPELQLTNIQTNQNGSYICQAFNTITHRYASSKPSIISVFEKVSGTRINPSSQPITEGMSVNLTCTSVGSDVTREWMKDGGPLSPSNRVTFSGDNKTVSIHPVNRTDNGVYLCRVRNPVSSQEATYSMTVNYGPDRVTIQGPLEIEVGQKLTLTCLTDSKPTANYTWVLNGTDQLGQSQELTIEKIQYNNSGAYTCTASNGVTGHSKNAVHTLNVKAEGSLPQGRLSGGAIAGIVIAVLVLVGVVTGLIVYFIKTKDLFKTTSSPGRSATGPGPGNSSGATDQELNYADISQFHKKDGGSVQIGNVASRVDSSSSANVRVNGNQPTYKPHLQDAKRPDPDPPSIYSEVRNS